MFANNKQELKNSKDGSNDKYYHAKSNAQAGQINDIGTANALSYGRELWDLIRKNTWDKTEGTTFKDVWNDSRRDIEADNYGLMQGFTHPFSNVDNILDKSWLKNLNKRTF